MKVEPVRLTDRVWIVRDRVNGELMPCVSVWNERPDCHEFGADRMWSAPADKDHLTGWLGSLWIDDAWHLFGVVPDDHRQVIIAQMDPADVRKRRFNRLTRKRS